jgi:hypothetical protein
MFHHWMFKVELWGEEGWIKTWSYWLHPWPRLPPARPQPNMEDNSFMGKVGGSTESVATVTSEEFVLVQSSGAASPSGSEGKPRLKVCLSVVLSVSHSNSVHFSLTRMTSVCPYLCLCPFVCHTVVLRSVCQSVSLPTYQFIRQSVCYLSACLSICLFTRLCLIYLSVCLPDVCERQWAAGEGYAGGV